MAHIVTDIAFHDLQAIWHYLYDETGNAAVADQQIDALTERFILLSGFPRLGRARDHDLGAGRRAYPVGHYVIVYMVKDDNVHILRVAHGKRDIAALMRNE